VIRPAVDQYHIVIGAEFSPQMGRSHDTAAASA